MQPQSADARHLLVLVRARASSSAVLRCFGIALAQSPRELGPGPTSTKKYEKYHTARYSAIIGFDGAPAFAVFCVLAPPAMILRTSVRAHAPLRTECIKRQGCVLASLKPATISTCRRNSHCTELV